MFEVSREDVLKGLRRYKRLAKQDFLASSKMDDPTFWRLQAEARRRIYDELIDLVEQEGVEIAYEYANERYNSVIDRLERDNNEPALKGEQLAYELFFHAIGVSDFYGAQMKGTEAGTN